MKRRWRSNWQTSHNHVQNARNTAEVRWRKSSPDGFNLWLAFSGGVIFSAIVWLYVHGGGVSADGQSIVEFENQAGAKAMQRLGNQTMDATANSKDTVRKSGNTTSGSDKIPEDQGKSSNTDYYKPTIRVYLSESGTVEMVPLETYVRGVVAAEMPLDFERAALEAQAMAARTYIIRRLLLDDRSGIPVSNADVTDTQTHQVYRSLSDMKRLEGENEEGWRKVNDAVANTEGEIIVFGHDPEPIEALYFSTSNGYTENSEEVFPAKLPYLRSVASPWDKEESPRTRETVVMRLADFYAKLDVKDATANARLPAQTAIRILEWTEGRRIKQMIAGSKKLSGEEVRHLLGLRSASFNWTISHNKIAITTYGSGHGVGMSQWGAEGMAKAGKTARQIVEYYYSGTRIEEVSKLAKAPGKRL